MSEIFAYSHYMVLKQEESKDANPSFIYGKILCCGIDCVKNITGKYVFINKISALKLIHEGEEYYITTDRDIVVYFS